jgi:glycosyltransferase involved in cell wall biosynthesis
MRILFINMPIEFYSPVSGGAISTIIAKPGEALIKLGHSVDVLSCCDGSGTYPIGQLHELPVRARESMGFAERKLRGLQNRIMKWDWPAYGEYLKQVRRSLRDASVQPDDCLISFNDLHLAQHLPDFSNQWVWLQNECYSDERSVSRTLGNLRGILCCSEYIRQFTLHRYTVPADRIHTLHSGVDLKQFFPVDRNTNLTGLRCLFVGRLDPNKGPDIAIQAVSELARKGLDVSLTVVGSTWFYGHESDKTHPYVKRLHDIARGSPVTFAGHRSREQLPYIYRAHDVVFVLSRSNEPFGLVTLEAMASGCAVISSNRGGLPEACGGAAALVDPDDVASVVGVLLKLSTHSEELAALKQASVSRAAITDWCTVAQKLLSLVG